MMENLDDISRERLIEIIRDIVWQDDDGGVYVSWMEDHDLSEKHPELSRILGDQNV